jgi:hypothetical protein
MKIVSQAQPHAQDRKQVLRQSVMSRSAAAADHAAAEADVAVTTEARAMIVVLEMIVDHEVEIDHAMTVDHVLSAVIVQHRSLAQRSRVRSSAAEAVAGSTTMRCSR